MFYDRTVIVLRGWVKYAFRRWSDGIETIIIIPIETCFIDTFVVLCIHKTAVSYRYESKGIFDLVPE